MAPVLPIYPTKLEKTTMKKLSQYSVLNPVSAKPTQINVDILLGMDYWYSVLGPMPAEQYRWKVRWYYTAPRWEDVSLLWRTEAIGISPNELDSEERRDKVFENYKEFTIFEDSRYYVRWPWKSAQPKLSSNFPVAKYRLKQTVATLCASQGDLSLLEEYNQIIQDQLKKGVIEPANSPLPNATLIHYISHFPVIRRDRATTKVRIVYDASAKTKPNGLSLNDLMHTGVNFLQDLVGLLLRFRLSNIVMISDVEKAFLQVSLQNVDRDSVRFLWFKSLQDLNVDSNLQVFRFTRTPFGVVASPYLLGATITHHMDLHPGKIACQVNGNTYMDNIFFSASTADEAIEIYRDAKKLFAEAGMNLREWLSNSDAVNTHFKPEDLIKEKTTKLLGLKWDSASEQLMLSPPKITIEKATKRTILHDLARVFGPLGLLSPLTIKRKILLQTLWKDCKDWDEDINDEHTESWKQIVTNLTEVGTLTRQICTLASPIQLLCFTDASLSAYASTIYMRQETQKGTACNLIFAKARVAPVKPLVTLPRLELLGAGLIVYRVLIGCRALRFVEDQLRRPVQKQILWSDSQIALQWIRSEKLLEPYVQRRVDEIRGQNDIIFKYVQSSENPADLATRGTTSIKLKNSNWLPGPLLLKSVEGLWPNISLPGQSSLPELKISPALIIQQDEKTRKSVETPYDIDLKRFSNLLKLLRVTAICEKFIFLLRNSAHPRSRLLNAENLDSARINWIKYAQQHLPDDVLAKLRTGKFTQYIKQLDLFLQNGIIRCGSRLSNAPIAEDAKFPILLPIEAPITQMFIKDFHEKTYHSGPRSTLSVLRQNYWVPRGLSQVRKVTAKCLVCRKLEGGSFKQPKMGDVPKERLATTAAFHFTGLDYLGPLYVKEERHSREYFKRWVALFTCFTTRAVHLELIRNCSAEAAVNAVARFVSRRGTPNTILTDNALQFQKGKEVLEAIWSDKESKEARQKLG